MANLGDLIVKVGADVSGFAVGMSTVSGQLSAVDKEAKKAGAGFERIGSSLTSIGMGITASVTLPMVAFGASAFTAARQMDDAMDLIRAGTGSTGDELAGLEKSFKTVFSSVPATSAAAASAIADLHSRLGLTGEALATMAAQELNLARVAATEVGPMIAATTRAFGDWSIASGDQGAALDYLFKTTQQTGIGITKLTEMVVQFGAPMRAFGFSFEESAALMGKWEKEGVNMETVLSGLRMALGKFAAAGKDPREALEGVVAAIKGAKTESEATAIAFTNFGKKAAVDMSRAIIEGRFNIDEMVKSIKSSSETINKAAGATMSFGEKWVLFKNNLQLAIAPLGVALVGAAEKAMVSMKPLLSALKDTTEWFSKLPPGIQSAVVALGLTVAAAGPAVMVFGQLSVAIGGIIKALALLPVANVLLATTFSGLVTAITSVSVAVQTGMVGALTAGELALLGLGGAIAVVGAAFAGWKIGLWIADMEIANDTLRSLRDAIFGVDSAAQSMAKKGMVQAEASAEKLRVKLAALGVVVPRGVMDITAYSKALLDASTQYGKTSAGVAKQTAAQGAAQLSAKQLKEETDRLKKANDQYAAGLKAIFAENSKHNARLIELGISTRAAKDQSAMFAEYLKTGVIPAANAVQTGMKDVDDAFKTFRQSLIDGDKAEVAMIASMKELAKAGAPVSDALQLIFDQIEKADTAAAGINKLGDAYKTLGITTSASLKQAAADAEKAYQDMASSGGATTYELQQAWVKVQDATRAAMLAVGEWTPAMEEAYQASKDKLAGMEGHTQKLKDKWKELGLSIKDSVGSAIDDVVTMFVKWDFSSFGDRMKGMFQEIGISVIDLFIKPAKDAIATFISETITDLLSGKGLGGVLQNVKDIGSTMADVFGGGAKTVSGAAGGASGAAGGIGGAVSGAGGGASGAAGGIAGAFNIAGAIGSLVGAGAAVAGDVILARIHTDTGRIEESARYSMLTLGGRGGGIFESVRWINDALGWDGAIATLLNNIKTVTMNELFELPMKLDRIGVGTDAIALSTAALANSGGPSITINIDGNVIGNADFLDSLSNALIGRLRLQGVTG